MKTVRLTETLKEKIVQNALIKAGITEAQAQRNADFQQLLRDILADYFKQRDPDNLLEGFIKTCREALEKMQEILPDVATTSAYPANVSNRINLLVGGEHHCSFFFLDENRDRVALVVPNAYITVPVDSVLFQRFMDLDAKSVELDKRQFDLRNSAFSIMRGITTTKKLLEKWPQAEALFPADLNLVKPSTAPTTVDSLNKVLGLK